jgi:acyl carrier protein
MISMDRQQFFHKFSELLELPEVPAGTQPLRGLAEWDSFAVISFIAMVDEFYRLRLVPEDVNGCQTLDELAGLVEKSLRPA